MSNEAIDQQHPVGYWDSDEEGLPVFVFTGSVPYELQTDDGTPIGFPNDPFFLLGNYGITAMAHASGVYDLYTMQRGWARPNAPKAGLAPNSAELRSGADTFVLTGVDQPIAQKAEKRFGTGFAKYQMQAGPLSVKRTLSIFPSTEVNQPIPALLISVALENTSDEPQEITYTEKLLAHHCMVGIPEDTLKYQANVNEEHGLRVNFEPLPKKGIKRVDREKASHYDFYPASLFLQAEGEASYSYQDKDESMIISANKTVRLGAGEKQVIHFVVGSLFSQHDQKEIVKTLLEASKSDPTFRKAWKSKLPHFAHEENEVRKRELLWNAYVLEAQAKYTEYFEETYIPQGMNYDYVFDNSAAIRDHLHYSLPSGYFNPSLSRSILRYSLKSMLPSGEMRYGVKGFGYCHPGAWIPSDFQLHLFWAVSEYLQNTGDYHFLTETTLYYPKETDHQATTLEKLQAAFHYLNDEVGFGPHGLPRVLNADWNDQVWDYASMTWYYGTAESHYNSGMAIVVLAELMEQLEKALGDQALANQKRLLVDLIDQMKTYRENQLSAFIKDLGNRDFVRRAYYKPGMAMGEEQIHLESQLYALMISEIPLAQRHRMVKAIEDRLMADEVLGARLSEEAIDSERFGKGARENGAIWYYAQGMLSLGLLHVDPDKAALINEKMSFANHAQQYPTYYPGQWTATDCANSSLAPYPGLSGKPDDEWITFPAYNMHIHAWPLLYHFRKSQIEKKNPNT